MKTRDSISKKRQTLRLEMEFWESRERDVRAGLQITVEDGKKTQETVIFCRQEIAKLRAALKKLETGSRWQHINGWK